MAGFFHSFTKTTPVVSFRDPTGFTFTNGPHTAFFPVSPNYASGLFFVSKAYTNTYLSLMRQSCRGLMSGYFSILHVKGIGFKVFYSTFRHSLYFNLGYNHITKYRLPPSVSVRSLKGYLMFYSFDNHSLGSVVYGVRHLRYPDPYRGKGVRFRFQLIRFKPGKQR